MKRPSFSISCPADLLLAGLGQIGSHLVPLVARLPSLRVVTLLDRGRYHDGDLRRQDFPGPAVVGRFKADVQAERLRRLNPELHVNVLEDDLATVPLGLLRSRLMVGGLDSLEGRLHLNRAAWRLGVAWLDGGVEPTLQMVRVNGYRPAAAEPCFECALDDRDYRSGLRTVHPCLGSVGPGPGAEPPPTGGTGILGAFCAAALASEIEKFFTGREDLPLRGRQSLWELSHHRHYLTSYRRNPACRFSHECWQIMTLPGMHTGRTWREFLAAARSASGLGGEAECVMEGHLFVRRLRCPSCRWVLERFHLEGRLPAAEGRCPHCPDRPLVAAGLDVAEAFPGDLSETDWELPMALAGVRAGDVFTLRAADVTFHVEIEIPACDRESAATGLGSCSPDH